MSLRIRKLADLVHPGLIPADIGTDHGLLPILLVEQGKAAKAYACDIAEGPLSQAAANIQSHGLEGKVIPILSDGFANVPDDADAAILAGMGSYTAIRILEEAGSRLCAMKQIILQVNDDLFLMRSWLNQNGFAIRRELTLQDHGHFYTFIDFGAEAHRPYTERDLLCGPVEAVIDPAGFLTYAEHEIGRLTFVIGRRGGDPQAEQERAWFQEACEEIKKRIAECR